MKEFKELVNFYFGMAQGYLYPYFFYMVFFLLRCIGVGSRMVSAEDERCDLAISLFGEMVGCDRVERAFMKICTIYV